MPDNAAPSRAAGIAHVLFLDIVGFSQGTVDRQRMLLERLIEVVNASPTYREARERGAAQPIPTGDGMILLFSDDVTAPARCAIEITHAVHDPPRVPVRMGIHSGLIQLQLDISGQENIVGEGVNTAQRVMDFGDDGHILLSAQYANWLNQFDQWQPLVTELGEGTAKHGLRLTVFTLRGTDYGRADPPTKLVTSRPSPARAPSEVVGL